MIVARDNRGYQNIESVFQAGLQSAILISNRLAAQLKTQVQYLQIKTAVV
ncbi:MAG: hypothetical protein MUE85_06200 [Microscillaceae bacterium]|nr:hypothetical protein [Microscillaceae bacterium]